MRDKSTVDTPVLSRGERLAHSVTALRAILRRVGWIHLDDHTAGAFSLARQDQEELAPSRVTDALGEMMILHHPFNVQIFDGHRVKLSHDLKRRLVMEIRASALNLLMPLLKQFDRFSSSLRPLFTSGDFALSGLQFPFGFAQEFRVLDHLACRERGEVLDPDINP